MRLYLNRLPRELKAGVAHVNWRYEGIPETKVLKVAGTLCNASSTSPRTWRPFRECVAAMERHPGRYAGVGRVIAKDDPFEAPISCQAAISVPVIGSNGVGFSSL